MIKVLTDRSEETDILNMPNRDRSLAVGLAEQLRAHAEGPDVRPGDLIGTKKELAERFSVSPGTLNEALRILALHGVVTLRSGPRGGVFAAAPAGHLRLANLVLSFRADPETMNDAMIVRDSLEAAVWLDIAEHAPAQEIGELRDHLRAMDDARVDPEGYLRRNWDLHAAAARLCRNRILRETYLGAVDLMTGALKAVESAAQASAETRLINLRVHGGLIDAALSRDPGQLGAAILDHAAGGRVSAKDYLAQLAAHSTLLGTVPHWRSTSPGTSTSDRQNSGEFRS